MKYPLILVFLSPLLFAQDAATVDGVVVNSITGAGIEGADVRLSDHGGHRYEAVTDQTGAFRITGVVAGDYDTSFDKLGYFRDDPFLFAQARRAHVGSGATHLRFELIPPGTLRGRVIGVGGKPAAGVEVSAIPRDSLATARHFSVPMLPFAVVLLLGETIIGFQLEDHKVSRLLGDLLKVSKSSPRQH